MGNMILYIGMACVFFILIIACITFKTFEEYLRELECAQTDGQTYSHSECINIFEFCWKHLKRNFWFFIWKKIVCLIIFDYTCTFPCTIYVSENVLKCNIIWKKHITQLKINFLLWRTVYLKSCMWLCIHKINITMLLYILVMYANFIAFWTV